MTPAPTRRERVEPPDRRGWAKLRRGLPELEGEVPTSAAQWNYERLVARVGPPGALLLFYVLDRTESGYAGRGFSPPEYAHIEVDKVADYLNVSARHARVDSMADRVESPDLTLPAGPVVHQGTP